MPSLKNLNLKNRGVSKTSQKNLEITNETVRLFNHKIELFIFIASFSSTIEFDKLLKLYIIQS